MTPSERQRNYLNYLVARKLYRNLGSFTVRFFFLLGLSWLETARFLNLRGQVEQKEKEKDRI
jgi:hypothetical protein